MSFNFIYISLNFDCRNLGTSARFNSWNNPALYMVGATPMCTQLKGLSPGQIGLCQRYTDHMPSVGRGAQIGIHECQSQFKSRRWNCSTIEGDSSVFGPVLERGMYHRAG